MRDKAKVTGGCQRPCYDKFKSGAIVRFNIEVCWEEMFSLETEVTLTFVRAWTMYWHGVLGLPGVEGV